MKKLKLSLILFSLFLFGCTPQVYIQKGVGEENIIAKNDVFKLSYTIINPTEYTFIGNMTYEFNEDCVSIRGSPEIDPIEVAPKKTQDGKYSVVREFQYKFRQEPNTFPRNENPRVNCFQTPLKINMFLYDKIGGLKSSAGTTLIITNG